MFKPISIWARQHSYLLATCNSNKYILYFFYIIKIVVKLMILPQLSKYEENDYLVTETPLFVLTQTHSV